MRAQPFSKLAVLFPRGMQFIPYLLAASGGTQACNAQFGGETGRDLIQAIQLGETKARQNAVHRQAELLRHQQLQAAHCSCENTRAANAIIGLGSAAVQADLKINRLKLRQAVRALLRNQRTVGADTHH